MSITIAKDIGSMNRLPENIPVEVNTGKRFLAYITAAVSTVLFPILAFVLVVHLLHDLAANLGDAVPAVFRVCSC